MLFILYPSLFIVDMTDTAIINILKQKGIYVTNTRVIVFKIMYEYKGMINASQIHKLAMYKLDRVSVYRTLQAFLKKDLVHIIPNSKGWPKYLIKNFDENKDTIRPNQIQIYFICNNCGLVKSHKVYKHIPEIIPANHQVNACQIILEGKCSACNQTVP